jgi:predicted Zn finger-like uncharacterized protein
MYTQCPDCSTAFRVTADVLKQAAGKVRCGGCGNAFNALAYLSESLPQQTRPKEADAALPELKPDSKPDDGLPASISAEQSAALLKTLDELAGSDIRIEDTGVEWRVLDDDEIGDGAADEELIIDEVLDESPTPVDQFLTETPAVIDSPEIFEEPPLEFSRTSVDEIRFDDNTVLPDDFDLDDDGFVEGDFTAETAPEEPAEEEAEETSEEDPQVDLDLSEPDEWTDILGEFAELAEAVAAPVGDEQETEPESEADLETEPELESDIEEELDALEIPTDEHSVDEPLDMDSQFALQAEAMGLDLSGMHETVEAEKNALADEDVDLEMLLRDSKQEDLELEDLLEEELVDEFDEAELEPVAEDAEQLDLIGDESKEQPDPEPEEEEEEAPEEEPAAEFDEELNDDLANELEEELEDDLEDDAEYESDEEAEEEHRYESDEHYVPPMTEEEQTINMQIDQDLLALAVEDEDGFASTIVIAEAEAEEKAGKDKKRKKDKKKSKKRRNEESLKETGAGFETIIMEGEAFRSTEDIEKLEADAAEAAALLKKAAEEEEAARRADSGRISYGLVAGIVALLVLLAAQYVHQSRQTLATIPAFNSAVGPLYRAIGQPLSPSWDITGWRFEVAKGTEEGDESLTIYSRLGNKSEQALPYPLIGVSLTDIYEETIGSRILDPADYLPDDLDPRKLVQPGNTFEAVITIQSPAEAAEGFRLRACYRTTDGLLRCKDDGFK